MLREFSSVDGRGRLLGEKKEKTGVRLFMISLQILSPLFVVHGHAFSRPPL